MMTTLRPEANLQTIEQQSRGGRGTSVNDSRETVRLLGRWEVRDMRSREKEAIGKHLKEQ